MRTLERKTNSATDFEKDWQAFKKSFRTMSKEKILKTFVDAGILTEKGNVRKPYRNALKKVSKTSLK